MKISELRTAQDVHREDMRNLAYVFWHLLRWLPNRAEIARLRRQIRKAS